MLNVKKTLTKILTAINAPIIFKVASRSITQNAGSKDYWTLTDSMEAKTGYTRVPIAYGTTDGALAVLCTRMNGDAVEVQTFNYAGSQKTATIICLYIWIRDDLFGGGYFLKVFSRLAERRWEYAEYKENSHKNNVCGECSAHGFIGNNECWQNGGESRKYFCTNSKRLHVHMLVVISHIRLGFSNLHIRTAERKFKHLDNNNKRNRYRYSDCIRTLCKDTVTISERGCSYA